MPTLQEYIDDNIDIPQPPPNDRADAEGSRPVALSNEDFALLTEVKNAAEAIKAAAQDITTPTPSFGPIQYVDVTLSLDTNAYASGDLLADSQVVAGAVREDDAKGMLYSIALIDEDDQGAALDLYFLSANVSMGTENSAPSISDANARNLLGLVSFATGDYKDLGGAKVAFKSAVGMVVQPVSGTDDIYVAAVNGSGTPTYTASGLKLRLGFLS